METVVAHHELLADEDTERDVVEDGSAGALRLASGMLIEGDLVKVAFRSSGEGVLIAMPRGLLFAALTVTPWIELFDGLPAVR